MSSRSRPAHTRLLSLYAIATFRRRLPLIVSVSLGLAAGMWRLSPWSDDKTVGTLIFIVAGAAILASFAEWCFRAWTTRRSEYRVIRAGTLRNAQYLDQVVALGRAVMGDGHAGKDTLRMRLKRCPDGVLILMRRPHKSLIYEVVVGYFACWTISANATQRFLTGRYTSALDLREKDFVATQAQAAYITMVVGTDYASRRRIISIAAGALSQLFDSPDGPRQLLARPATKEGRALMRKIGMQPLQVAGSSVWSVDVPQLTLALASIRQ